MSGQGWAVCLDAKTGDKKWAVDTVRELGGRNPKWGFAESVLIDGDNAFFTPGSQAGSAVAMNKKTGKLVWSSKGMGEQSAYCSPMLLELSGKRRIVTMLDNSIVAFDAATGQPLWRHPYRNKWAAHPNTPMFQDGMLYDSAGYGEGGFALKLSADGAQMQEAWVDKKLDCHHGGMVLLDGYIYGSSSKGQWICLELKSGKVMHEVPGVGKGSVTYADGMLYCYGEKGKVGLVKATPTGHDVISSFQVRKGSGEHWAHPVVCGGRLYVRHGNALMAYDVKGQ